MMRGRRLTPEEDYFCTVDRTNPNSSVKDIHVT